MPGIKRFDDWPVKNKLSFIVLITSIVLIAVMLAVVTVEKTLSYRAKAFNNSTVLAAIIGENSTAALTFRDKVTAKEILSALKAEKDIMEAALYVRNGSVFAHYVQPGHWGTDSTYWFSPTYANATLKPEITFNAPWFTTVHDIVLGKKVIGHVVLRVDLSSLNTQLLLFTVFMTTFSLVLLTLAMVVCMRLNQAILGPVSALAETMSTVSETQNYEVSVSKRYDDEIGVLVDGFNNMLAGIRKRDDELAEYRDDLQNLVRVRTAELEIANEHLKHEIEERKEIQKRLVHAQKMEAIGTLAGGVAHDLNNILSGVVTYPDLLLLQLPSDSSFVQPLETIRDSGRRAAAIVQDLLTLARRGVKVEEQVDFQDLIVQYIESLEFRELQKDHPEVTVHFTAQDTKYFVKGSSIHLSKTIMNLISNGMEAIEGQGVVSIQLERVHLDSQPVNFDNWRAGEYVELKVRDTGVGIAGEYQERIFEPFFSHKVMGKSGTGLGMSVVWGTVEDHNGFITLESCVGEGTTFQLLFPLMENSTEIQVERLEKPHKKGRGETVLVVDDSKEQRLIAADILKHLGYKAITLSSGEAAVDYLRKNSVDLLILDMLMDPGISGLETFRRIMDFKPEQKAVIASGFSQQESIEDARSLGVADFVVKPYSVERIGESLHKVLEKT